MDDGRSSRRNAAGAKDRKNKLRHKPRDELDCSKDEQVKTTKRSNCSVMRSPNSTAIPSNESRTILDDSAKNETLAKKFSSRNSLRSSQIASSLKFNHDTTQLFRTTMPPFDTREDVTRYLRALGIDEISNYARLGIDSFGKQIGNFYYCVLCCKLERKANDQASAAQKHSRSDLHIARFHKLKNLLVRQIPQGDSFVMNAISLLLAKWYDENSLTDDYNALRMSSVQDFEAVLTEINPESQCRLLGSFVTNTALKSSNINLELIHPSCKLFESDPRSKDSIHHKWIDPTANYGKQFNNHITHYDLITNASDILYKTACVIDKRYSSVNTFTVQSSIQDLNNKVPKLVLRHEPTQSILEINCHNNLGYNLSLFLGSYLSLDDRATVLAILIKHWAKFSNIDHPEHGTFAPETYIIMMIYFLQRTQPPVLPCLHENLTKPSKTGASTSNAGREPISKQLQKLIISDPINSQLDSNTNGFTNDENGLDSDDKSSDECLEDNQEDKKVSDLEKIQALLESYTWESSNDSSITQLFIEFLRFMFMEFSNISEVISIRTLRPVNLASKSWNTQVKAIEHPLKPSTNISRCIGSQRTFDYIRSSFAHTFYYLTSIPMDNQLGPVIEYKLEPRDYSRLYVNCNRLDFYFEMREQAINKRHHFDSINEMIQQNVFARDVEVTYNLIEYGVDENCMQSLPNRVSSMYNTKLMIPQASDATLYCWLCKRNGHLKTTCSKGEIERLRETSLIDDNYLDSKVNLDDGMYSLYVQDLITPDLSKQHQLVLLDLTRIIQSGTGLNCRLQLFGSTVNCLGTYDSDLDICMTIDGNVTGQGLDCVNILTNVEKILEKMKDVADMESILSARVPILKFQYKQFKIDLSMYNLCALHNSKLIKTYVLSDHRVAKLFYLVKRYAKGCGIADASRGSLSSYAWSLMVIHFLQQIQPPILPVLQETDRYTPRPSFGVNGWDVWFNDDIDSITMPQNNLNLTQLFKMFLYYYANFDFDRNVISIRTSRLLTKFQKNWNDCMMAIEDPFELTYNLSGRLDDPMAIFVMNSFARTYNHFSNVQKDLLRRKLFNNPPLDIVNRIFNGRAIMGSDPPRRGCRICFRIGHRAKDCPETASRRRT